MLIDLIEKCFKRHNMQICKILNNDKMVSSILYKIRILEVENMNKCFSEHFLIKQREYLNYNIKFCFGDETLMFYLKFFLCSEQTF